MAVVAIWLILLTSENVPPIPIQSVGMIGGTTHVHGNLQNNSYQNVTYIQSPTEPVKCFRNVPVPIDNWRKTLLKQIQKKLQASVGTPSWHKHAVKLVGYGGMGKSELARKFAAEYKDLYPSASGWDKRKSWKQFSQFSNRPLPALLKEETGKKIAKKVPRRPIRSFSAFHFW